MSATPKSEPVRIECEDFDAALAFYRELEFRLDRIRPADEPDSAWLSGHGIALELHGRRVDDETDGWKRGRAGMRYRDLIPDRAGGRFIASHIRIDQGGVVPDYVHYHDVACQVIVCVRGWVRVVYEDQGPAFVMRSGDAVLQPPKIRHRVLECSDGLEVVEFGSPAEHDTFTDHDLDLPTDRTDPDRRFGGQRFVRFRGDQANWQRSDGIGFERCDLGMRDATNGALHAEVARRVAGGSASLACDAGAFVFRYVLSGSARLGTRVLGRGDVATDTTTLHDASEDFTMLLIASELGA